MMEYREGTSILYKVTKNDLSREVIIQNERKKKRVIQILGEKVSRKKNNKDKSLR